VVASIVVSACGSTGKTPSGPLNGNVILASDINATPPGSPQRAMLSWFQAVQFGDPVEVLALTAPATVAKVGAATITKDVAATTDILARPQLLSTRFQGNVAYLRVLMLSYVVNKSKPVLEVPATVTLEKIGGSWKMLGVGLLIPSAAT
jgi:hypothetical protein